MESLDTESIINHLQANSSSTGPSTGGCGTCRRRDARSTGPGARRHGLHPGRPHGRCVQTHREGLAQRQDTFRRPQRAAALGPVPWRHGQTQANRRRTPVHGRAHRHATGARCPQAPWRRPIQTPQVPRAHGHDRRQARRDRRPSGPRPPGRRPDLRRRQPQRNRHPRGTHHPVHDPPAPALFVFT